ncbi:AMP-binding protein [Hymenobacter sp.]|jgi:acyl-CoA synthetase (AMP-forming)/AMP-acid ligase II|uniref:AMP-binding protein n=1 Tax=Hymenobacter sp. TaxID=1898978 RepID=UPI002EDBA4F2
MNNNYFELIHAALLRQLDEVCIVWPAEAGGAGAADSYTGGAVLRRVEVYRAQLLAQGVGTSDAVLLALPVSIELICALLAVMALGAVPVLPPAGAALGTVVRLVRRLGIRMVVVGAVPGRLVRVAAWLLGVRVCTGTAPVGAAVAPWTASLVSAQQPALVSHSSGSTGTAKSIRRSHQVLQAQHAAIETVFPPWPGQRDFPLFPNILLHNLAAGVVSVLPDLPWGNLPQLNPARLVAQLVQHRVQTLTGNVFYFRALLAYLHQHPVLLPHVVAVGIGGSPVPEPLAQELRCFFPNATIHIIYGSSEAEPIAVRPVLPTLPNPLAGYCVGAIQAGLEWRIEPLGQLKRGSAASQQVGELWVRGAHVATPAPGQWLRTGDYGYVAEGQLYLTGRQGNERLHQGVQHYQLEHLLYHLPGVERVAARADKAGFTLFVQGTVSHETVTELLAKNFPASICQAIHLRATLPVDARHYSKILYHQLR